MFFTVNQVSLIIVIVVISIILILGVHIVPKNKVYIIERMGVYYTTWQPGIHFLLFGVERIREKINTNPQKINKEFDLHSQINHKFTFNVTIDYQIKDYVNFAYRKDIVLLNLDEIVFSFLETFVASNLKEEDITESNSLLLFKMQNHADLIDLQILNVSVCIK